jgi:hypothetical protein
MSGAAAAATGSKMQAFMNHPAGTSDLFVEIFHSLQRIGPKTIFFWAPLMKWCLVAAGLKDLARPAEKLSVNQNVGEHPFLPVSILVSLTSTPTALAATGFIWVRYSLVIYPINYSLAAVCFPSIPPCFTSELMGSQVNFFVGASGVSQLYRIWE